MDLLMASHKAYRALLQLSSSLILHFKLADNCRVFARDLVFDAKFDHRTCSCLFLKAFAAGCKLEECIALFRLQKLEVGLREHQLKRVTILQFTCTELKLEIFKRLYRGYKELMDEVVAVHFFHLF